jgi:2-methylisocitrate lyase-like PEP mutase family enzyme
MAEESGAGFRALHRPGRPFVLANAWDRGTARLLVGLGAAAIGTTSSGFAFTRGLPDGGRVTRDQALDHAADLAAAVSAPVSADLENGYADDPEDVAETIRLAGEAGLAGASIEDTALPGDMSYPFELAVERIRAAVAAARGLRRDFVLVARADGLLTGGYGLHEAMARIAAFDAAGADCLYVPGLPDLGALRVLCASTLKPVNALVAGPFVNAKLGDFGAAGAARVSLGGSLARLAQASVAEAARSIFEGDFSPLGWAATSETIDPLLAAGSAREG